MLTVDEAITFQIANDNGTDEQKPANVCQHVIRTVKTLELPADMAPQLSLSIIPSASICGQLIFSDTSSWIFGRLEGSIGQTGQFVTVLKS